MLHGTQTNRDDGSTPRPSGALPTGGSHRRVHELEAHLARQRQLLEEAAQYLHEAAYLARYHQPALERHIRAFLDELDG